MFPTLQIGPLSIATPGLIILVSLWIGLELVERRVHVHQVPSNVIYNLVFWSLLAGILGARVAFVARYPQAFLDHPLNALSLNTGILDPLAGLIVGAVCFLILARRTKLPIWSLLDALTPGIALLSFGISFSQLAAGTAYGLPTSLPWAIDLWNANRHPTQIYAMITSGLIFTWVWFQQARQSSRAPGELILGTVSLLSGAYLLVCGFCADSTFLYAGIRSEQVISWIILAIGLWGYQKRVSYRSLVEQIDSNN